MNNRKNKQDDKHNIYPSDYIDYTPNSQKSPRFIRLVAIVFFAAILLLILFRIPSLFHTPSLADFPESIEKVAHDVSTLNNKVNKLTDQFSSLIKNEDSQLEKRVLRDFQSTEENLNNAALLLDRVEKLLMSESDRLKNILQMDTSQ